LEQERAHHAAHYAAHRDEDNARRKAHYAAHREEAKVSGAAHYRAHREEIAAWSVGYYAANRERIIARGRAYRHAQTAARREARGEIITLTPRERGAAYRQAHRAEVIAYRVAYRAAHREELQAYAAAYHERERERARANHAAWEAANPDRVREHRRRMKAVRRGAPLCDHASCLALGASALAWQVNPHVCYICGTPVFMGKGGNLHFDHVIPISRGGVHCAENLRPACAPCNQRKAAKVA
jgi:5-methylcytosine-specific restriction endonuclease McrA